MTGATGAAILVIAPLWVCGAPRSTPNRCSMPRKFGCCEALASRIPSGDSQNRKVEEGEAAKFWKAGGLKGFLTGFEAVCCALSPDASNRIIKATVHWFMKNNLLIRLTAIGCNLLDVTERCVMVFTCHLPVPDPRL